MNEHTPTPFFMVLHPYSVFLVAGEPSGDALGARLMSALRRITRGGVRFHGVGGREMIRQGLVPLFSMHDLTVMGAAEVLPRLPLLRRRLIETERAVLDTYHPDAVVTIDSKGFAFRLLARLRRHPTCPALVHFVGPSVWAVGNPERAARLRGLVDCLLLLLPFEPPLFEAYGVPTQFVGHPVMENVPNGNGTAFRQSYGIPASATVVAVLPGSRMGEVNRLTPIFLDTLTRLRSSTPHDVWAIVIAAQGCADRLRTHAAHWPVPAVVVDCVNGDWTKFDVFAACNVALCASGTVILELGLANVPSVVAYRAHPLTEWAMRLFVRVPFASLPNIMIGRSVVPECLFAKCTPQQLVKELVQLLFDSDARHAQSEGMAEILPRLLPSGDLSPSERAAQAVLDTITRRRSDERTSTL